MKPYMTEKAIREQEEIFRLRNRAIELLGIIVAEFESDPSSVACFDLRIVNESKAVIKTLEALDIFHIPQPHPEG